MPSLRSSGKMQGNPTSIRQLAQEDPLSFPLAMRALLEALGSHGSPDLPFHYGIHNPSFKNFTDGVPDWGTCEATFGAVDV